MNNLHLPKLTSLALERTDHYTLSRGQVEVEYLGEIEFIKCLSIGWHVDGLSNYSEHSLCILVNPNHIVQAGKRQNLPQEQPHGRVFNLDINKRHRLLNLGTTEYWLAASMRTFDLVYFSETLLNLENSL